MDETEQKGKQTVEAECFAKDCDVLDVEGTGSPGDYSGETVSAIQSINFQSTVLKIRNRKEYMNPCYAC